MYIFIKTKAKGKTIKVNYIQAKSIVIKRKRPDAWFLTSYNMNIYRGCSHACVYCDGRAEGYQVDGDFDNEITVKENAVKLAEKELDPSRKRKPMTKGYIGPGGGVGDSYQDIEKETKLTRKIIEVIKKYNHPLYILTKSSLALRDLDLMKDINGQTKTLFNISLSTATDDIANIFEPGCTPPSERLAILKEITNSGITTGVFLMPTLPFITDTPEEVFNSVKRSKEAGASYIMYGGLTLKEGRQLDYFLNILRLHFPEKIVEYFGLYPGDKWGAPRMKGYPFASEAFIDAAKYYKVAVRPPRKLYENIVSLKHKVVIMLEHIDYFMRVKNIESPYGYAAYNIANAKEDIDELSTKLKEIKGVGRKVEYVVLDILKNGTSALYEKLRNEYV